MSGSDATVHCFPKLLLDKIALELNVADPREKSQKIIEFI